MGGLVAQFSDRIPASTLLDGDDAVFDQPLDAPLEVGPSRLPVFGIALLVRRAAGLQHWNDIDRGLTEVVRVTRKRIVFLTLDLDVTAQMWLCRDYLPEIIEHDRKAFPTIADLKTVLPDLQVKPIPAPADCTDGFLVALWSRPEAYLDPDVRRASSTWHVLPCSIVDSGLDRLRLDLHSGKWDDRYGHLRTQATLDIGLRLIIADL